MSKNCFIKEEEEVQDSMVKTNLFFGTLSFILCTILETWLHLGIPQKIQEK
jgi:hypothetical protein